MAIVVRAATSAAVQVLAAAQIRVPEELTTDDNTAVAAAKLAVANVEAAVAVVKAD